eukprot:TRINITY_DN6368_c0_g1_i2.p1 TRINITY_DN6368_c0_g1~~TRINITY_DN6368_c0_g1_i2.p1  ORF type:complete len:128 (+),score=12.04 TRINITY_DN6368_c0_g1_i2:66-449(+)
MCWQSCLIRPPQRRNKNHPYTIRYSFQSGAKERGNLCVPTAKPPNRATPPPAPPPQAKGSLDASYFDQRWRDEKQVAFYLFQEVTRLSNDLCNFVLEQTSLNLWRAWLLYQAREREGVLTDAHYLPE